MKNKAKSTMTDKTLIQKDDFAKEDFALSYMVIRENMSVHEIKRTQSMQLPMNFTDLHGNKVFMS